MYKKSGLSGLPALIALQVSLFLFNKFTGNVLGKFISEEGRWIIIVVKLDNSLFLICNVYGHNEIAQARTMFNQTYSKLKSLQEKYKDAKLILGGYSR